MNRHLLIDLNNLAHRAAAKDPGLYNSKGQRTGTVFGMLKMLKTLYLEFKPISITLCEDKGLNPARLAFYPAYKAVRIQKKLDKTEEEKKEYADFLSQKDRLLEYIKYTNIKLLKYDNTEADDIIGYISHLATHTKPFTYQGNLKHKVLIVSTDNDFMHLVSDCVEFYTPIKNEMYTAQHVNPEIELFKKCINGDDGDGITGIPGVGDGTIKCAFETIQYTDQPSFFSACATHPNNRVKKIANGVETVERNAKIISLLYASSFIRQMPVEVKASIKDHFFKPKTAVDYDTLLKLAYEDDFKSIYQNVKGYFAFNELLTF